MSHTKIIFDHLGRKLTVPSRPSRIISLCPSHTQTLYDIGCGDRIVGVTQYYKPPQHFSQKVVRVGGTKTVHFERVKELAPDLIIAEKEEQTPELIASLDPHYPVYVTEIKTVEDGIRGVLDLGTATDCDPESVKWADRLSRHLSSIRAPTGSRGAVLYFIWKNPWMIVHEKTFTRKYS